MGLRSGEDFAIGGTIIDTFINSLPVAVGGDNISPPKFPTGYSNGKTYQLLQDIQVYLL
ncbi:MAG: hypothetical protein LBC11_02025 [Puniceicoccales bacterium]|nr:hypothetical protein [Puniceicoccales bacterium]